MLPKISVNFLIKILYHYEDIHGAVKEELHKLYHNTGLKLIKKSCITTTKKKQGKQTKRPATGEFFFFSFTFALQFSTFCNSFKLVQRAFWQWKYYFFID